MLHSAASSGRRFADVQNKGVVLNGAPSISLQLVLADARQFAFHVLFLPFVAVNHHANRRPNPWKREFFKLANFHRRIRQAS